MNRPRVVSGIDGSRSSFDAARYAAAYASRHQLPLHLVYGYRLPLLGQNSTGIIAPSALADEDMRDELDLMLIALARRLTSASPTPVEVTCEQSTATGPQALIDLSGRDAVTVIGCRGAGGFDELPVGSVAAQVAEHAHNPVLLVRDPQRDDYGPIVVGVDSSDEAAEALEFAVEEAVARTRPLVVVHALAIGRPCTGEQRRQHRMADSAVAETMLAPWQAKYPQLRARIRVRVARHVAQVLLDAAGSAALTVVGARGDGGFPGQRLGSVARAVAWHAAGPVAIVRAASQRGMVGLEAAWASDDRLRP
jgi:nucleotide-binding universal stress UspA family protein